MDIEYKMQFENQVSLEFEVPVFDVILVDDLQYKTNK